MHLNLSKNKSFESEIFFGKEKTKDDQPFDFRIRWTEKMDHAGPSFTFGIKGLFYLYCNIYDHRHWDDELNCWKKGDEKE